MPPICKGLCVRFKHVSFTGNLRYAVGQKWCSLCALYYFTEERICPCCKVRLRTKPRSKK